MGIRGHILPKPGKQDNEILDEFQEGFILKNDRVIRHSVVRINKLEQ